MIEKAFIRDLDDQEAFLEMVIENQDREDISTWSRAMSFKKALDSGIYPSQGALAAKLNISRTHLVNMMAYTRIPEAISKAIGPMHKVSIDTANKLAKMAENESIHERLIELAPQIANGKLSGRSIEKAVKDATRGKESPFTVLKNGNEVIGKLHKTKNGDIQITLYRDAVQKHGQKTISELLSSIEWIDQKQGA
ncbi:ParB/RepB/Spo0J family partition protein [Azotobacter salinestris]|uniref:ParB/RepB/Spo0J family partition protein n=1 Tax=Azotobacter salinestris TaxID=69964 RepID=UPI001266D8DC|nr:ParB/RepB/Spo0J family partition protein [Azotobacter salinestris]